MRLNWGALAVFAAYAALVILLLILIAAAWLYRKIRHLACGLSRKRRDGKLTRAERRKFRAVQRAYGDVIGTATVEWRAQAAEARARRRAAESGES